MSTFRVGWLETGGPVPEVTVVRCPLHSAAGAGAEVWVRVLRSPPRSGCPCETGERFVVVAEGGSRHWLQAADVFFGAAQSTLRTADEASVGRLRALPGCGLVATPSLDGGAVLATRGERIVTTVMREELRLRAAETYGWLLSGRCLREVSELLQYSRDARESGAA